jgi:hypothetical protein
MARDYAKEYRDYHGKPEQIANRSQRNQARGLLGLAVGDKREVDHKTPISKGGGNGLGILARVSGHREIPRRWQHGRGHHGPEL